ncbi:MAG: hypothetical protein NTZ95_08470 [Candidatus Omnitrophica bacterium]|nr:hypothetical protein [Candidatus Omnitrophota bacterium]
MKIIQTVIILIAIIISASYVCSAKDAEVTEVSRWDSGAIKETVVYDPEYSITIRNFYEQGGSLERVEKYDSLGNKIEISLYDANGNLREGLDGWAAKRWRYIDGKVFQETTYGTDGKPRTRRTFSESGKLVARQYMSDGESEPDDIIRKEPAYGTQAVIVYGPGGKVERAANVVNE